MAINLGNIVGNTVSGISSGLDTASLIKGLSSAKQTQIDNLKDQVTVNNNKISAFSDLKTLVSNLQNSANFLRNPPGIANASSNVFNYRKVNLSSSLSIASYLSVTAGANANVGKYNIQIGNIAEALQQRSGSFTTRDSSATDNSAANYFNAGTFTIGSGVVKDATGTSVATSLNAAAYTISGAGSGIVTTDGIKNLTVTGASGGQAGLLGKISSFTGSFNNGSLTVSTVINGVTYTSNAIAANSAIGSDTGILAGTTLKFTADNGGANQTSFDITLASDVVINDDQTNTTNFLNNLRSGVAGQTISQTRQLQNFTSTTGILSGLTSANVKLTSSGFDATTASFGSISGFKVQKSTGSDGAISVSINGETFRATGLGTSVSSNLVLQSSSGKKLNINLADAGITVDLSSDTAAQNFERALDYTFGTRSLNTVTVTAGETLADIAYKINAQSNLTGMSASVVKVSDFDYRLSLKSNNVGIDNAYEIFDPNGVTSHAGLTTTQAAEDSVIKIDGTEITRSSNTITDAIDNMTLNLLAATPGYGTGSASSADINVTNDVDSVVTAVQSFLNNYYDFRVMFAKQTERDSNSQLLSTSVLGDDTTFNGLADLLSTEMLRSVSNVSSNDFSGLANLGITLNDLSTDVTTTDSATKATSTHSIPVTNALVFDEQKLRDYLTANFDKVREIFEFKFTSSSDQITVFSRTNAVKLNNFKLAIDTTKAAGQQVQILNSDGSAYTENGNPVYADYSGGKIVGKTGTALDGLQLIYTGSGNETVSVSLSQGIADKIYNIADNYTKSSGTIETAVNTVKDNSTKTNTDVTSLEDNLAKFVANLQSKFNALEQALARVNNILDYLTANDSARNKG